jgi:hypothetical protein
MRQIQFGTNLISTQGFKTVVTSLQGDVVPVVSETSDSVYPECASLRELRVVDMGNVCYLDVSSAAECAKF